MPAPTLIRFPCGDLTLEGRLIHPETGPGSELVVVAHPHPQYGGDMDNSVVGMITGALTEIGHSALVFNFRGVGGSQGSFGNGEGEQDDLRAAIAFGRSLEGVQNVNLAGYSFGAGIVARAADASIPAIALVSLPTRALEVPNLQAYPGRILLATGSLDDISSIEAVRRKGGELGERVTIAGISGADHFWWGKQGDLAAEIREFFAA